MALSHGILRLPSQTNLNSFPKRFLKADLSPPAAFGLCDSNLPASVSCHEAAPSGLTEQQMWPGLGGQACLLSQPDLVHSPETEGGLRGFYMLHGTRGDSPSHALAFSDHLGTLVNWKTYLQVPFLAMRVWWGIPLMSPLIN